MFSFPRVKQRSSSWVRQCIAGVGIAAVAVLGAVSVSAQPSFITFESGHVRPVAITPDGSKVLAVNTPDNRVELFQNSFGALVHREG